jgi:hypothetical protein
MENSKAHIKTFGKAVGLSTLLLIFLYILWQFTGLAGEKWGRAWELLQSTFGIAASIGGAWVAILIASNAEKIATNAVQLTKAEHTRELNKRTVEDVAATQNLILDLIKSIRSVVTSCSQDSIILEAKEVALFDILVKSNSDAVAEIEDFIKHNTDPRHQVSRLNHLNNISIILDKMRDAPRYRSRIESIAEVLDKLGNALLMALNDFRLVRLFSSKMSTPNQESQEELLRRRDFLLRYADACLLAAMRLRRIQDDHVLHLGHWALSIPILGKVHKFGQGHKREFLVHDSFTVFGNIISQDLILDFKNDQIPYIAGSLFLNEIPNLIPTVDHYKSYFQKLKEEHGLRNENDGKEIDISSSLLDSLNSIGFATQLGKSYVDATRIANLNPAEDYTRLFSDHGTYLDEKTLNNLITRIAEDHWLRD